MDKVALQVNDIFSQAWKGCQKLMWFRILNIDRITNSIEVECHSSYNYPTRSGSKGQAYYRKTLEIMYDSKKRPHKIVIYSKYEAGMSAIDLDANTYK